MADQTTDDVYNDPDNILADDNGVIDPSDKGVTDDRGSMDMTDTTEPDLADDATGRLTVEDEMDHLGDMDPADEHDGTES